MSDRPVLQPIYPEIEAKLLPEYAAFHREHLQHTPYLQDIPWSPSIRQQPAVLGGSEPLKVAKVQDIPLSHCSMRTFTPEGDAPAGGWPVFIFFHGGTCSLISRIDVPLTHPSHFSRWMDTRDNQHRERLLDQHVQACVRRSFSHPVR